MRQHSSSALRRACCGIPLQWLWHTFLTSANGADVLPTIQPLNIRAWTVTSALGRGCDAHAEALQDERSGLRGNDFTRAPLECAIGRVDGIEDVRLPAALASFACRNNHLAWLAMQGDGFIDSARACIARHGAHRVALLVGTSTSSIHDTEVAYRRLDNGSFSEPDRRAPIHTPHATGTFLAQLIGVRGPCLTISTACSSSARVFADAERLLRMRLADAVIVGGVDSLCDSVLYGFSSLELVASGPCRPFARDRSGISIGEAAGFALLERADSPAARFQLAGYGESSDAWHMSTPHPHGDGARMAIQAAMQRAGKALTDVDYINLHGTGTAKNDETEARLIADLFPGRQRASSTKGFTGHSLGAAGIVEAALCLLAMQHGIVPATLNGHEPDDSCGPQITFTTERRDIRLALSNSFGFGGNNCTLAFSQGCG